MWFDINSLKGNLGSYQAAAELARQILAQAEQTQPIKPRVYTSPPLTANDPSAGRGRNIERTISYPQTQPIQDPLAQEQQNSIITQRGSFPGLQGGPAVQDPGYASPQNNQATTKVPPNQYEPGAGYLAPQEPAPKSPVDTLLEEISTTDNPVSRVINNQATPTDRQAVKKAVRFYRMKTKTEPNGVVRPTGESVRAFFDFMKDLRANDPERFDYVFSEQAIQNVDLEVKRAQSQMSRSQSESLIQTARKIAQDIVRDEKLLDVLVETAGIEKDKLKESLEQFYIQGKKLPEQLDAQIGFILAQTQALELANKASEVELGSMENLSAEEQVTMRYLSEFAKLVGVILAQDKDKTPTWANEFAKAFLWRSLEETGFEVQPKRNSFNVMPPQRNSPLSDKSDEEALNILKSLGSTR